MFGLKIGGAAAAMIVGVGGALFLATADVGGGLAIVACLCVAAAGAVAYHIVLFAEMQARHAEETFQIRDDLARIRSAPKPRSALPEEVVERCARLQDTILRMGHMAAAAIEETRELGSQMDEVGRHHQAVVDHNASLSLEADKVREIAAVASRRDVVQGARGRPAVAAGRPPVPPLSAEPVHPEAPQAPALAPWPDQTARLSGFAALEAAFPDVTDEKRAAETEVPAAL